MNYLQLAQRLHQEIAGGPNDPGTDPDAVTGLSGELLRYANWIQSAWVDIQQERTDWRWMWRTGTQTVTGGFRGFTPTMTSQSAVNLASGVLSSGVVTVTTDAAHPFYPGDVVTIANANANFNGTQTITSTPSTTTFTFDSSYGGGDLPAMTDATATLQDFDMPWPYRANSGRPYIQCYLAASGATDTQPIYYYPWHEFGGFYDAGNMTSSSRPAGFSVSPDRLIQFTTLTDAPYTILVPYRKKPQNLVLPTATPEMPAQFHMLIVWRALLYYGTSNEANRAAAQAQLFYNRLMNKLKLEQVGSPV